MRIRTYLNGIEINDPVNLKELSISLNYDKDDPRSEVSINNWELGVGDRRKANDGAVMALNYRNQGLTTGVGVTEGIPYKIDVEHMNTTYTVFDGYLDLWKAQYFCDLVNAPAIESGGIDWFNDRADSFDFERLFDEGIITKDDFVPVPYIISSIPDYQGTVITILSLFVIANELKDQIQSLAEYVSAASNPFTANIIIAVILRVAYIVALLVAVVKFLKDLFNLVIQPVKYHMGMYELTLCQKACEFLGFKFKSSILETAPFNKSLIIPEKYTNFVNENDNGILGYFLPNKNEQVGYFKGTFGKLIRDLKTKYKAKVIIRDGYIMLEREDFDDTNNNYEVPPVEILSHTLNSQDFISNYILSFQTDLNDKNTIQQYPGTSIGVQQQAIAVNNQKNLLLRNSLQVQIPYSLVKVKTELTFPEKIFNVFFKTVGAILGELIKVVNKLIELINKLIGFVNKIIKALKVVGIDIKFELKKLKPITTPNISNLIENRIGMMTLQHDDINVPKMLLVLNNSNPRNNKPLPHNGDVLNAVYLYNNFHFVQSFVPSQERPNANQYEIYDAENVPFTFGDYEKVRLSNKITNSSGEVGKVFSLDWNLEDQKANIKFGINKLYTKNLREIITIPDGR